MAETQAIKRTNPFYLPQEEPYKRHSLLGKREIASTLGRGIDLNEKLAKKNIFKLQIRNPWLLFKHLSGAFSRVEDKLASVMQE